MSGIIVSFSEVETRSIRWLIDDRIDNFSSYSLPYKIEQEVTKRLPFAMECYLRDREEVKKLEAKYISVIDDKTREVLRKITNEDIYQNAVFGEFMRNTTDRINKDLNKHLQEKNKEIENLRWNQNLLTFGLVGSFAMSSLCLLKLWK